MIINFNSFIADLIFQVMGTAPVEIICVFYFPYLQIAMLNRIYKFYEKILLYFRGISYLHFWSATYVEYMHITLHHKTFVTKE